jgi:hypothetical protein
MITIREGFLILTAADGGRSEYVNASKISRVTRLQREAADPRDDATLVLFGDPGWYIEVCESPGDIIEAIGAANKVNL